MENICVFTGRKGSGKDTLFQTIRSKFIAGETPLSVKFDEIERCSFSDELRYLANELFPWCPVHPPYHMKEEPIDHPDNVLGLSPRGVWKHIAGEDVTSLRRVDPDILVNRFRERWGKRFEREPETLFVITDWRTEQEEAFIESQEDRWPRYRVIDGRPVGERTIDNFENMTDTFDVNLEVINNHDWASINKASDEVIHSLSLCWGLY